MSAIAGQTAGPNGLNFFEETHGCPGSYNIYKYMDMLLTEVPGVALNVKFSKKSIYLAYVTP